MKQHGKLPKVEIAVLGQHVRDDRIFRLVKVSMPKVSSRERTRILGHITDETKAIGMVEWWTHGCIIDKPKTEFYIILII